MLTHLFRKWEIHLSRRDVNRRIRPFEWGTEFVQGGISIQDPKEHLLEFSRRAVARSDEYHSYEPVKDFRLEGQHLTFTSPLVTKYAKNNTVHGWYFPKKPSSRAVLVLPQWNSNAQGHMSLCRILNYL